MHDAARAFSLLLSCSAALWGLAACDSSAQQSPLVDPPPQGLDWSNGGPSFSGPLTPVEPYTGDDETVLDAQARLSTGSELHAKVVLRSCGPLGGVCHNQKEYPDMRTPYNFLSLIDAPCNVQSGTLEGVYDRCERVGDRFALDSGPEIEIGWIEVISDETPDEEDEVGPRMPGLHLHLADPIGNVEENSDQIGRFIRTFVAGGLVEDISYARFNTRWYVFDGGLHVVGRVRGRLEDDVKALLEVGVEQGDLNRNGVFGARPDDEGVSRGPVALISRGSPETSYLVARLFGRMEGEPVPGSRMPLANPPFSLPEMLALFCFIEGLPAEGNVNLASPIDYKNCSYSDPETHDALTVEGVGTGWPDRIAPLLEANCGGCHSKERAEAGLVLVGADVYDALVNQPAGGDPEGRPYVTPGDPSRSYLYLKLTDDPSIAGLGMPLDPLQGVRKLSTTELGDIEAWILGGAGR